MQLETLVKEFLFECEIREYSPRTVENYKKQRRHFTDFLKEQRAVETLEDLQASKKVKIYNNPPKGFHTVLEDQKPFGGFY